MVCLALKLRHTNTALLYLSCYSEGIQILGLYGGSKDKENILNQKIIVKAKFIIFNNFLDIHIPSSKNLKTYMLEYFEFSNSKNRLERGNSSIIYCIHNIQNKRIIFLVLSKIPFYNIYYYILLFVSHDLYFVEKIEKLTLFVKKVSEIMLYFGRK